MYSTGYCCQILMKLESFQQFFEKILKYKISRKSVRWEPSCYMRIDGRTARRIDMTKLIVAFRSFAKSPN